MNGIEIHKECPRQQVSGVSAACSFSRISQESPWSMRAKLREALCDDCQIQLYAASASSWRVLMVDRFGFLESPVFDRKGMTDEAMKPQ